ncbi:MAG: RluA family pseudouridine synthase [Candidatus Taylorbacteria bacterium]|nr:RluA family pseudouridine synthase [Candidatus Taylorbacteria bacterium]
MLVLYEDNHIIAVFKPAGVLVQKDKSGEKSLMEFVKEYLKEKHRKPGNVFLGLVHRLDRNVSGIVLFGKTSKGASRLSEQFRDNETPTSKSRGPDRSVGIKKTYHAVVEGEIKPANGDLVHYLKKDEKNKIALVSDLPKQGYDRSELSYKTILPAWPVGRHTTNTTPVGFGISSPSLLNYSLLAILLKTGRFHQIRAQLSAIGYPIVGDKKYGAKSKTSNGSLALCATEIEFKTATTDEVKNIKIDYPEEWNKL